MAKYDDTVPLYRRKLKSEGARRLMPGLMPVGLIITMRDGATYERYADGTLRRIVVRSADTGEVGDEVGDEAGYEDGTNDEK